MTARSQSTKLAPLAPLAPTTLSLPEPGALPTGDPDARAPAPGPATEPDTRSLRGCDAEGAATFAVVYRRGASVVTGRGRLGCRGRWQAVEYPSVVSAISAFGRTCARLIDDGYADVR